MVFRLLKPTSHDWGISFHPEDDGAESRIRTDASLRNLITNQVQSTTVPSRQYAVLTGLELGSLLHDGTAFATA